MHLVLVSHNYFPEPTGIPAYNTALATWFRRRGWRVTVLTGVPHYPWWKVPEPYASRDHRYGLGDEAREIQDLFLGGDRVGAAMALSTDVIDMCGVACTPDELGERMGRFETAGADSVIAIVFGSDREGTIARLAAL